MAVFGIAFGMAGNMVGIVVFGFCFTLLSNIFSTTFHIYQAEIFPTSLRATATSWTYSLSRLSGGVMPFFLVPLLNAYGAAALFAVVACALVVLALDVLMLGPRTSGRALESVNPIPRVS
jgi:putative MFS transporter